MLKLLEEGKFSAPLRTGKGESRACVSPTTLETLWVNSGTLCNLACDNCYIESTPQNDRLSYLEADDLRPFLDEIRNHAWATGEVAFTGGEPFLNPHLLDLLQLCLERNFSVLVLTNAMRPMLRSPVQKRLLALREIYGDALQLRVSVDHYTREIHERERGEKSWAPTVEGLRWLCEQGFSPWVAARQLSGEDEAALRDGFHAFFTRWGFAIDAASTQELVIFPEMDERLDVPEITTACWDILGVAPESMMCATTRMVVKRKGADKATVVSCTLLPYLEEFELGATLEEAWRPVPLNHPHCARFCVLGGASCSGG